MKKIFKVTAILLALLLTGVPALVAEAAQSTAPDWLLQLKGEPVPEKPKVIKKNVKVPILLYHHITDEAFSGGNEISLISPSDFRLHMTAIKINFTPISLRQYYEYILDKDGSVTLPENPIIVTFDDGYLSNYEIAFPILKELEIPATIFVVTDTVGAMAGEGKVNYSHFTWEQAREMEESGLIEIHSHTASHKELAALPANELVLQLRKSKYAIEKNLGHECDMIAFPYGSYNDAVTAASHRAGYQLQVWVDNKTTEDAFEVNLPSEGLDGLVRMTVSGTMGNVNVIEVVRRAMAKKIVPQLKGWE
ncbi:MAG: polysaccharide deacetylase family protein [Clostridia bacterium]|nr:polysaccharide deacetylase family protein [Clostridia bacterium]